MSRIPRFAFLFFYKYDLSDAKYLITLLCRKNILALLLESVFSNFIKKLNSFITGHFVIIYIYI